MKSFRRTLLGAVAAVAFAASAIATGVAPAAAAGPAAVAPAVSALAAPVPHDPNVWGPQLRAVGLPCLCGGGTPLVSDTSPWTDPSCASSVRVGSTIGIYAHTAGINHSLGWAEWRYGYSGSCNGLQWGAFHLNMDAVYAYLSYDPWMHVSVALVTNESRWTRQVITFTGGQADGVFKTYAVDAGATRTIMQVEGSSIGSSSWVWFSGISTISMGWES